MAALIQSLYFAGSRLSTGAPNDTGTVYAYVPGTVSPATLYADADATVAITQPITLDAGGRIPYSTYPDGVWITAPVRLLVQDVDGNTVSDAPFWPADARDVALDLTGFTSDTVADALAGLRNSVGGTDSNYKESAGATNRSIQDKFREIWISVKDFGAVGNGVAIDTTAIQNAFNSAKALASTSTGLGSVAVWFPAGNYKIDQAITQSSARVNVRGESSGGTQVFTTHTSASAFTFTSCQSCEISGLRVRCAANNSAPGISLVNCSDVNLEDLLLDDNSGALFLTAISSTISAGSSSGLTFDRCALTCQDDSSGRALKLSSTSIVRIFNSIFHSGTNGVGVEFAGTTSDVQAYSNYFTGSQSAFLWASGMTGTRFCIFGNPTIGSAGFTSAFDMSGLSTDPKFRQFGNSVDGYTVDVTSGGTVTPDRSKGPHIRIRGTTTAVAYVVAAPTPIPTGMRDVYLRLSFFNNAGGAVTGWTLNGTYHMAAVSTTNLEYTSYTLVWDADAAVWREHSRAVTT